MRPGKTLSGYVRALAAVFVSSTQPRSRHPKLLAWRNYSSQSFGVSSILLFKAAGTLIYASKIAPCPRPGPIAHGTFPIRWATSGVDFVQPSSRSPRSPQSEITLWAAETYSTRGYAGPKLGKAKSCLDCAKVWPTFLRFPILACALPGAQARTFCA